METAAKQTGPQFNYNSDSGLMYRAAQEIKHLRNQNNIQSARLKMFDDMMSIFNLSKRDGGMIVGEGSDNAYQLEERANVLRVVESLHPEMQSKFTAEALENKSAAVAERP